MSNKSTLLNSTALARVFDGVRFTDVLSTGRQSFALSGSVHNLGAPSNDAQPQTVAPNDSINPALQKKREIVGRYYKSQLDQIRGFLRSENFTVAEALIDFLVQEKKGIFRKNDYTPEYGHQIDQLLPLVKSLYMGDLKDLRSEIEAKYGSVEKWIIAVIVHDMGEDDGMFPETLEAEIRKRLMAKKGSITESEEYLAQRAGRSMERLTHYRKYKPEEFTTLTGANIENLDFDGKDWADLTQDEALQNFFAKRMRLDQEKQKNLRIFAAKKITEKNGELKESVKIIVTQYGTDKDMAPAPDWNRYVYQGLLFTAWGEDAEEDDFYDLLVKIGDRNQGAGSRIAITGDTEGNSNKSGLRISSINDYDRYLEVTGTILSIQNIVRLAVRSYYPGTPLEKTINSLDNMNATLVQLGDIFVRYYPERNVPGDKGLYIRSIYDAWKKTGVNAFYFSRYLAQDDTYYKHTPTHSHPLAMIMRELREYDVSDFPEVHQENLKRHYELLKDAIVENGPEYERFFASHMGFDEESGIWFKPEDKQDFEPAALMPG